MPSRARNAETNELRSMALGVKTQRQYRVLESLR
jgi:hypothetical protein